MFMKIKMLPGVQMIVNYREGFVLVKIIHSSANCFKNKECTFSSCLIQTNGNKFVFKVYSYRPNKSSV